MSRLLRIQLVAFLALTVVGVAIAGTRYAGIADDLFADRYQVVADFADAGGIFAGAEVTYRGVTVGRVTELRAKSDGVEVVLRLDGDFDIPSDATATVANRSAIGEQYVDLRPDRAGGPFLADGGRIDRSRTAVPVSTAKLLADVDALVGSVPAEDLATVVGELGTAFRGTGPELGRLIDAQNDLLETADANLAETISLLENGRTVLGTQLDSADHIRSFAGDLADLTDTLVDSDADIRTVLDEGLATAAQIQALVEENESDIPILLSNLATTGRIVEARLDGVQHILILYPYVVRGGYTVIDKDPETGHYTAHFGLQLATGPGSCREGYEGTQKRTPDEVERRRANEAAGCTDSSTTMRGTQHAPVPDDSSLGDPSGATGAGGTEGEPGTSKEPAREGGPLVIPHDPTSGRVELPDGRRALAGPDPGLSGLLDEDSWVWLLLGGLSPPS